MPAALRAFDSANTAETRRWSATEDARLETLADAKR